NQASFRAGNELRLTVILTPGAAPMPPRVDGYVVLRVTDGSFFSLTATGGIVPGLHPIAPGFTPVPLSGTLIDYVLTGTEPPGAYAFFAALTQAGMTTVIGTVGEADFTIGP